MATTATIVRAFRIMRIFRLIRASKNLKVLIDTLVYIIPSITNLGTLIFLLLFIYSALGMNLFAEVAFREEVDEHANFRSFGIAMMTLMRCATGENWQAIMFDLASKKDLPSGPCLVN